MKSEIDHVLGLLYGTKEYDVLVATERLYKDVNDKQTDWYEKSRFLCPDGCGSCCHDFEPDLLECEALYMAAWLLENQYENALKIADSDSIYLFDNGKTCPFYNNDNPYHCSIYGGRPFVCRLFGASCSGGKNGESVWRPCRFYPEETLAKRNPPVEKRQYSADEAKKLFPSLPPVMSDIMEQALSLSPDSAETKLIRDILPGTIRKLLWIFTMNGNDNDTPRGSPNDTAA
ncbi:MAG: YkgJ family cysteine cluster protein [Spirochaetaceae bacterium]|nr:YkgJ family cysteine cluster protein [Spirochaetaceae bacterium]